MAKIAFVQHLFFEYLGLMSLAAMLKKNGHSVDIFIETMHTMPSFISSLREYNPDIIGFGCTTGLHQRALYIAQQCKRHLPNALIVFGGPHPTFFPQIINHPSVDIICRGESEFALLDLANAIENHNPHTKIQNLWVKQKGEIVRNNVRDLIGNLDILPFPDRALYTKKYPLLATGRKSLFVGRGCPNSCSFCFNHSYKKLYAGSASLVRLRSVQNVMVEIKEIIDSTHVTSIYIQDDIFGFNRKWAMDFLAEYKKHINLPFICLLTASSIDEDFVYALKESNCQRVFFGVETGSEILRQNILQKGISNKQIYNAGRILKKHSIKFRTYNIFGIPMETIDDALKTVIINQQIQTDFPWSSLLAPFPQTAIAEICKEQKLFRANKTAAAVSFFSHSPLALPHKMEIENIHKLFFYAIRFSWNSRTIKQFAALRLGPCYTLLFWAAYLFQFKSCEMLSWRDVIRIGIKNIFCGLKLSSSHYEKYGENYYLT